MKILIVDDEKNARENLYQRLRKIDPLIEVIAESQNTKDAFNYLSNHDVDLIFLDIEMPGENGFQLLDRLDPINFEVIFVTAYNEYALEAFQHLALAYITKPIDNELLVKAYQKAKRSIGNKDSNHLIKQLSQVMGNIKQSTKIAIPIDSGLQMIDANSIILLEANEGYVIFELDSGNKIVSSKRLTYYEGVLNNNQFIRIHRSFIVNVNFIEHFNKIGFVKLSNNKELPISKSYKTKIKNLLQGK